LEELADLIERLGKWIKLIENGVILAVFVVRNNSVLVFGEKSDTVEFTVSSRQSRVSFSVAEQFIVVVSFILRVVILVVCLEVSESMIRLKRLALEQIRAYRPIHWLVLCNTGPAILALEHIEVVIIGKVLTKFFKSLIRPFGKIVKTF
jgi:hypothetical protein